MEEPRTLLVATSRYLLRLDLETEKLDVVDDKHGLYYGVSWDEERFYVAARWYPSWMPTSMIERPRLLVFDAALRLVEIRELPVPAGGLHQILYHDGHLFCSCSREDSFAVCHDGEWSEWHPSADPEHRGRDVHHFNSVWIDADRIFVVGHNNGPSDVWELSWPERRLVGRHRVGEMIHNVWREDGTLAVCNSGGGKVETVDGRVLATTGGFPRGVVIGPTRNVVGVSGVANRSNRWMSSGKLQVFGKDWRLEKEIGLGRCGQVTELRSLDGDDHAHNGLPAPG